MTSKNGNPTNDNVDGVFDTRREVHDGGVLHYAAAFYSRERANEIVDYISTKIPWENLVFTGKCCRRATAWFADEGVEYRYSRQFHVGNGWDALVDQMRRDVECATQATFNSVLMHRYPDGRAAIGWHADNEPELGQNPVIASLSFGATRVYKLRHNTTGEVCEYPLAHGSLFFMAGTLQHFWQHCVPPTNRPVGQRFNLTFRYTAPPVK